LKPEEEEKRKRKKGGLRKKEAASDAGPYPGRKIVRTMRRRGRKLHLNHRRKKDGGKGCDEFDRGGGGQKGQRRASKLASKKKAGSPKVKNGEKRRHPIKKIAVGRSADMFPQRLRKEKSRPSGEQKCRLLGWGKKTIGHRFGGRKKRRQKDHRPIVLKTKSRCWPVQGGHVHEGRREKRHLLLVPTL